MFFSYLDMSLPFFEADGYNGIEKGMLVVTTGFVTRNSEGWVSLLSSKT